MPRTPMGAEGWGIAILIAFETPNLFSGFLPSLFTISTFSGSDAAKQQHTKQWIRKGELQAGIVSVGLGIGGTVITRTPWPLLLTLGMIAWLVYNYEHALRKGCADGPGMDIAAQDAVAAYRPAGY
jgi:hypothetical protein